MQGLVPEGVSSDWGLRRIRQPRSPDWRSAQIGDRTANRRDTSASGLDVRESDPSKLMGYEQDSGF
jgi:hypothetical protein